MTTDGDVSWNERQTMDQSPSLTARGAGQKPSCERARMTFCQSPRKSGCHSRSLRRSGPSSSLITHAEASRGGYGFHRRLYVCLFIRTISQKPMQLGSPNLTQKRFTGSSAYQFILRSKGQRSKSRVTKTLQA